MLRIAVLGAGVMATALTFPAVENGNEVRFIGTHLAGLPPEPLLFRLRMRRPVRSEPRGDRGPVIPDLHTVQVYRDRASIQFFIDNAAMGVNIVTHDVCASPFASQLVNTVGCHMTSRHQNRVGAHRSWRIHHEIRVLGSLQGTRNGHVLTQHLPEIC